jgi:hypothetical protein
MTNSAMTKSLSLDNATIADALERYAALLDMQLAVATARRGGATAANTTSATAATSAQTCTFTT